MGFVVGLGAILGIVFGFVARRRIRADEGATRGSGLALAGIVVGFVALATNITVVSVLLSPGGTPAPVASYDQFGGDPTPADTVLATAEALPASAYPTGFHTGGSSNSSPCGGFYSCFTDQQVRAMAACVGTTTSGVDTDPAEYAGPMYQDADGETIAEDVEVYPDTGAAVADVTALTRPHAAQCWSRFNLDQKTTTGGVSDPGSTEGATTGRPLAVPLVGDHAAGVQLVTPFTAPVMNGTGFFDVIAVQKGRSEAVFFLTGVSGPDDAARIADLTRAGVAHLSS